MLHAFSSRQLLTLLFFCLNLAMAAPSCAQVSAKQIDAWRASVRHALFIPEPLPSLNAVTWSSFSPTAGVVADRVTYATEYSMRIPAIVYRPVRSRGRMPGIVVVNGHGADKTSWYSYYTGILYASAGAVVVTYDPVGEGERNDEHKDATGEHDKFVDIAGVPQRMGGLMQTDVMQAVSYLRSLPQVDPDRIAVLGFSMGSFVSSITGAIDPRIHALLLTGGGDLDGPGGYWDSSHAVMCQAGPWHALAFLGDRPAAIFAMNARRGPTFILNGTNDTVVAIPEHGPAFFEQMRHRATAMNGSSRNMFETYFDPGASHRPAWVQKIAAEWLDRQLHFPNWPEAKLKKLPTISIGKWAAVNNVRFNKSQLRTDRDAGLEAIDVKVPLLTPDQLNVLPLDEWKKQQESLAYSSWMRHAIAEAQMKP